MGGGGIAGGGIEIEIGESFLGLCVCMCLVNGFLFFLFLLSTTFALSSDTCITAF